MYSKNRKDKFGQYPKNINVNFVVGDESAKRHLRNLDRDRVSSKFFNKGLSLASNNKPVEEIFAELQTLVDEYVAKGYDEKKLLAAINNGIKHSQMIDEKKCKNEGRSR